MGRARVVWVFGFAVHHGIFTREARDSCTHHGTIVCGMREGPAGNVLSSVVWSMSMSVPRRQCLVDVICSCPVRMNFCPTIHLLPQVPPVLREGQG